MNARHRAGQSFWGISSSKTPRIKILIRRKSLCRGVSDQASDNAEVSHKRASGNRGNKLMNSNLPEQDFWPEITSGLPVVREEPSTPPAAGFPEQDFWLG